MEDLCEQCYYREKSRQACEEALKINPSDDGIVCDPAPRAECKEHKLYGKEIKNKIVCEDFRLLKGSEKFEYLMKVGLPRKAMWVMSSF